MTQAQKKGLVFILLTLMGWAIANTTSADLDASRVRIGLKLFRTILAADLNIKHKQTTDGQLALALIYNNDKTQAQSYAEKLKKSGKGKSQGQIRHIPIHIDTISSSHLQHLDKKRYAGIYIAEKIEARYLQQLIAYGIKHQIIIYSPFEGAVEQGSTAGLIIEARVKPHINTHTLRASKIQLKSFFLKVSKKYEP